MKTLGPRSRGYHVALSNLIAYNEHKRAFGTQNNRSGTREYDCKQLSNCKKAKLDGKKKQQ